MHPITSAMPGRRPEERGGVLHADLCILGAGSGGLSIAAGAAQMGASVVLIEKHRMGGDCLNTGCVPSKALLAAAHAAESVRGAGRFGVNGHEPTVDYARVHAHIHGVIAAIAPHDSVERFEGLGATVIQAAARFTAPDTVEANGQRIRARRFVIATGSRAALPPIPGLADTPFLTNETIFDLTARPDHLVVVGGGPIGIEMAQAYRRLGARVTLLERFTILPKDEPEAVAILRRLLLDAGIALVENADIRAVAREGNGIAVTLAAGEGETRIAASHLLIAAGRKPNTEDLGLEQAGIAATARGITVDASLRTSNKKIFAVGDVAGGPQFTHIAGYHAGIVVRQALFGLPAKVDYRALPWVTYSDPELAHAGLSEEEARKAGHAVSVLTQPFTANDRAQAEAATEGLMKIVLGRKGLVLGATILGRGAGEQIGLWALAISQGLRIGAIAQTVLPYPTFSELSKRTAGGWYTPSLFAPRTRKLVGFIQRFLP